ncbi:MAG: hypothetical protein ACLFRG_21035 [Desulfococcaceae bacterium]
MDSPYLLAAGASFLAGMFGYVIVRFWAMPIARYRRAKAMTQDALDALLAADGKREMAEAKKACRVAADRLSELYSVDLPPWYRMVLDQRGESPVQAAKDLMTLSNTKDPDHQIVLTEAIRKSIGL